MSENEMDDTGTHAASYPIDGRPALRRVRIETVWQQSRPYFVLIDPLRLRDNGHLAVSASVRGALLSANGARDLMEIQAEAAAIDGYALSVEALQMLFGALEEALLLEGPAAEAALVVQREAFRALPFRVPSSAGAAYPADADALRADFERYTAAAREKFGALPELPAVRGVVSPHIDFARGGPVYAQAWLAAAEAVKAAELVVIFGTDHASGPVFTLTKQHYATPFGVLPTDGAVVDKLATVLGEQAFAAELHHVNEHSLELVLAWVHWLRGDGDNLPKVVPILNGGFALGHGAQPNAEQAEQVSAVMTILQAEAKQRPTLFIASGDLAHLGPVFGTAALFEAELSDLQATDADFMAKVAAGDAEGVLTFVQGEADARQVCGTVPFYLMLRALGDAEGLVLAYDQCAADVQNESWVSVGGAVLG